MKQKTLVRVESELDGIGIFMSKSKSIYDLVNPRNINELIDRFRKLPIPQDEKLYLNRNGVDWFCGFRTIKQFKKWVKSEEVEILAQNNYKVFLIKCKEYQLGKHQVIFTKESVYRKVDITHKFIVK